jgi:hypothetical protein
MEMAAQVVQVEAHAIHIMVARAQQIKDTKAETMLLSLVGLAVEAQVLLLLILVEPLALRVV